jgi:hypothetical protein
MKSEKPVSRSMTILNWSLITLIIIGVISILLSFVNRQNYLIYNEIVLFVAFLFFMIRGAYFIWFNNFKLGIICFVPVVLIMILEMVKVLMYNGAF